MSFLKPKSPLNNYLSACLGEDSAKPLAIGLSLLFHAFILLVSLPSFVTTVRLESGMYHVPIKLSVVGDVIPSGGDSGSDSHMDITNASSLSKSDASQRADAPLSQDKGKPRKTTEKDAESLSAKAKSAKGKHGSGAMPGDRDVPGLIGKPSVGYPKMAENAELQGNITVEATISKEGKVADVAILKSTGHAILDKAFVEAVKTRYQFEPKQVLGEKVASKIKLEYVFELSR